MKYILSKQSATLFAADRVVTIRNSHPNWEAVKDAIRRNDETTALRLADVERTVKAWSADAPDITVRNGQVYHHDKPVHNVIAQRILSMIQDGFDANPLCNFLTNVLRNPSNRAVEELYKFLEHNNLPITEQGHFYAYKRIRHDWMDVYSGTISNHIGAVITMPRNEVNDDPTQTCSHGLHVASLAYLSHYAGERLVLVEVDPADVVSVPIDYNNTKMRVCRYSVVSELDMSTIAETDANWKAVYAPPVDNDKEDDDDDDDDDDDHYYDDDEDADAAKNQDDARFNLTDASDEEAVRNAVIDTWNQIFSPTFDPTSTPLTTI